MSSFSPIRLIYHLFIQKLAQGANDWAASGGTCEFGDDYYIQWLFPANYPDGCTGDYVAEETCFSPICDFDFVVGAVRAYPRTRPNFPIMPNSGPGSNFAFWDNSNKNDTLLCIKFKGYSQSVEVLEDEMVTTLRGHAFLRGADTFSGINPNNLTAPAAYYMKGGVSQYTVNTTTGFSAYTKAIGQFVDLCEIRAAANPNPTTTDATEGTTSTKGPPAGLSVCQKITKERKCRGKCEWVDGECVNRGIGY